MSLIALAAVDGPVILGNERDLGGFAALCAYCIVHLAGAGSGLTCIGFACAAASLAAGGLVLEALLSVEFLLTGSENEFSAAVFANQSLVLIHGWVPPVKNK